MIVFLNGQFVPEAQATVSVFDRAFLYGDGLFETMRVANGKPFRWWQHLERLRNGGDFLGIKLPFACKTLEPQAQELITRNQMPEALLRLTVSRGVGLRGYSPSGAVQPTVVMTLHPLPAMPSVGWKLHTSSFRLPAGEPLAHFKTANKLAQILARAEADAVGADEALLCNTDGHVVEGASSNLFWLEGDTVCTPPLASGILAGVTRAVTLELCAQLRIPTAERQLTTEALRRTEGLFLTLSSLGIVPIRELDGAGLPTLSRIAELAQNYEQILRAECA